MFCIFKKSHAPRTQLGKDIEMDNLSANGKTKDRQRGRLHQHNCADFPPNFTYDDLQPYWSCVVKPHERPDTYLQHIDHTLCFTYYSIKNVLDEADLLDAESPQAKHCQKIIFNFKQLMAQRGNTLNVPDTFSEAVHMVERDEALKAMDASSPWWLRCMT